MLSLLQFAPINIITLLPLGKVLVMNLSQASLSTMKGLSYGLVTVPGISFASSRKTSFAILKYPVPFLNPTIFLIADLRKRGSVVELEISTLLLHTGFSISTVEIPLGVVS